MEAQIVTLGAAKCGDGTNAPICRVGQDLGDGELSDMGEVPLVQSLGLTAIPAAADDTGHAEGILLEGVGGLNGVVLGGRDTRAASVVGSLSPGDTAIHSTGGAAAKRSQVRCQEDSASILVGNDMVFLFDRKNKKVTIAAFGGIFQMSEDAVAMSAPGGKACLNLGKDGAVTISGSTVSIPGGLSGGATALPLALATPLATYLTTLQGAIASGLAAIPGGSSAGTAFTSAMVTPLATLLTAMPTKTTTGS